MIFLTCLFDAVSKWFDEAAWFQLIKWPFWFFVILIAFGGLYTAIFQKNTLLCRGITGALKLAVIYMFCIGVFLLIPPCMDFVKTLPFITFTEKKLTLVRLSSLFDSVFSDLPRNLVKLYFLLLCINFGAHLDYGGRNWLSWFGCQLITCILPVIVYKGLGKLVNFFLDFLTEKFQSFPNFFYTGIAICLLLPLIILMTMKCIFIVFRKSGNPTYSKIMQFLSGEGFGSLFFVTFFSELVLLIFLRVIHSWEMAEITLAAINPFAYILIMLMCIGTLLTYSMYFTQRKVG